MVKTDKADKTKIPWLLQEKEMERFDLDVIK